VERICGGVFSTRFIKTKKGKSGERERRDWGGKWIYGFSHTVGFLVSIDWVSEVGKKRTGERGRSRVGVRF